MSTELSKVVKELEKKYGITIVTLENDNKAFDVDVIPTGLLPLDIATGIGGIPRGYYTEVFSPDAVGKTTLCIQIVAQAQKLGLDVAYIDMEHRFDPAWASKLGVDLSKMYFTQPPYGEAALNTAQALIEHGGIKLIVIDSIPSLVPKKEIEGAVGDEFVGLQPRIISQNFRQMTPLLKKHNAAVMFTNQVRAKIGGMASLAFGAQTITPGGWAVKFYASLRLDMKRIKTVKDGRGDPVGHIVKLITRKNSLAVPLRTIELYLRYGVGFDPVDSIIDLALANGIIEQGGAWFSIGDSKVQGRAGVREFLEEDDGLRGDIEAKIKDIYMPGATEDES